MPDHENRSNDVSVRNGTGADRKRVMVTFDQDVLDRLESVNKKYHTTSSFLLSVLVRKYLPQLVDSVFGE